MRLVVPAFALGLALSASPGQAQPLEQNFAFGAPPSVLGNDRVRIPRQPAARAFARKPRGQVKVLLRPRTARLQRWRRR